MGTYARAKQRTKDKIRSSFWELYKTNKIEKITVKDITDTCGIHRATFYLHYADVYEILEEIEKMLIGELREVRTEHIDSWEDLEQFTMANYTLYQKNWEYLHCLLREQKDPEFAACYKNEMMNMLQHIYQVNFDSLDVKSGTVVEMAFFGIVDMFIFWADEPQFSYEDMMNIMYGFIQDGIEKTLARVYGIHMQHHLPGETGRDDVKSKIS